MIRVLNPAPATYDLAQLRALAAARFGATFHDLNERRADDGTTQVAVYLDTPAAPPTATLTAWGNDLAGYVPTRPTAADIAANQAALVQRAQAAIATNVAYLAIGAPANADVVAQVRALTKECTAVIRLLVGQLDDTAGT